MAQIPCKLGQIGAPALAILAALAGAIGGYAGKGLSKQSEAKLTKIKQQVAAIIGDEWEPLSSDQIERLRVKLEAWHKPEKVFIMYENKFGKSLAESLATAFRAAKWEVQFSNGSGFEQGIKVGRGLDGPALRDIIADIMGFVTALGPTEDVHNFFFVGVGAKSN